MDIVILGGGFGGLYTLRGLHKELHGRSDVKITLINRTNYFLFTPLLHEVATGSVTMPLVVEPLRGILRCCLHKLVVGEVEAVDVEKQRVLTDSGEFRYDCLVLALGTTTDFRGVPGAQERAFALKSAADAKRLKNHIIDRFERALMVTDSSERDALLRFVVVGGGATGVELAAEIADFCYDTAGEIYPGAGLCEAAQVVLVEAGEMLLPQFPADMRKKSQAELTQRGVRLCLKQRVEAVTERAVKLSSGEELPATTVVWVAGVKPTPVKFVGQMPFSEDEKIEVKETLQVKGHDNIFALGDIARFVDPVTGQVAAALAQTATKQAATVAKNLAAQLKGGQLRAARYRHAGDLVSLGRWQAVANIKGLRFSGPLAWWLWRAVYLGKMLTWRKKLKVAIDWIWDQFQPRDVSQLP